MARETRDVMRRRSRILGWFILLTAALTVGCGGNAGVENGTIIGKVFSNFSRGVAGRNPESDVAVVAQREQDFPMVIRTTKTDANGEFVLTDVPVGQYVIGFAKTGFQTIDTQQGATATRTAVGSQVRVFVEPNSVATAPEITLRKIAEVGNSTVVVTLQDASTGQPINNATVTVGTATSSNGGNNGVYTLAVPVNVDNPDAAFGQPGPERVIITADGFGTRNDITITPIADETVRVTIQMVPELAILTGFLRISAFENLYQKNTIQVQLSNVNVNPNANINPDGSFTLEVPRSTTAFTRQLNIVFTHPGLDPFTLSNVVAPIGGARTINQTVVMTPRRVDLVGTVLNSTGQAPNNLGPVPDTATALQTGQVANIINGSYVIPSVPTGFDVNGGQITVRVRVFNPARTNPGPPPTQGVPEQNEETITPFSDGSANPTFTVPLIVTQ